MAAPARSDGPDIEDARRPPYLAWAGLAALLVIEVLALTLRFDVETLGDRRRWAVDLLAHSPALISLGTCVGMALALGLYQASRVDRRSFRPAWRMGRGPRARAFLVAHLGSYGLVAWLTWWIFEGPALSTNPLPWMVLWVAAGLMMLGLWMLAALPLEAWSRLVRARWDVLVLAGLAGAVAMALGHWTSSLWGAFHGSTFRAVGGVLGLFYGEIVCRPEAYVLGTGRFEAQISAECSGYEGIGLICTFLGIFCWWSRDELRFPRALLLFPLGATLSWVANVLRIAALIAVGDLGRPELALGGFHSQAGWLAFNAIALGLVVLARRAPWFMKAAPAPAPERCGGEDRTAAHVAPLVALALAAMVAAAVTPGRFDFLYSLRVLAGAAVLWSFRRRYADLWAPCSWQAIAVGLAVFAMWTALEPPPSSPGDAAAIGDALARMPRAWAWGWLVARCLGSVVVVPLAEELAFRGYLTRRLIAADFQAVPEGRFTWPSFLISSLLFGLLHQRRVAGTIAGMAFALAYYRRGKLIDAVAAHAMTNLCITLSVLATGDWWRWS